ncbi:MAG: peptidoglycan editing factor PgeF [Sulfurimonas sp.]|nr:peptidoglycan editing factor PgeF [Sulfurimonas sp.]
MKFSHSKVLNSFLDITHAFTTKECQNLAFHVGDNEANVVKNHEVLAKELGYNKESLVFMKQVHSDIVHIITNEDFNSPPTCDALITNKPNTPIMVMVADCSPILFYDDKKKVIAAVHAGRAGAFKNIVKKTVDSFTNDFSSEAKDLYVSIGASIGVCCYEVGEEIYAEAKERGFEYAMHIRDEKYYLDVNKILKSQLLSCGVKEEKIEFLDECSCCKTERYFSYRAEKETGRFAGVIMLN